MKTIFQSLILIVLFSACVENPKVISTKGHSVRDSISIQLNEFEIPQTTIRALEVLNDSTVWFGGSNGRWGFTRNNGKNWNVDSLKHNGEALEIRSVSVLENDVVFLVGVAKPAVVYRSQNQGKTWNLVYEDTSATAFFDAIDFWDNKNGMLLGDPQEGCFHLTTTTDGGETWNKVNCENIPRALEGEGPFAASNTNIALNGNKAWFATGGKLKSRVFQSEDYGQTWTVVKTPIVSGLQMTGIFSIDFYNESLGVAAGGNWETVSENANNVAFTEDGGASWEIKANGKTDGYISCVQFIPETQGGELFALKGRARGGESSMSYSSDGGETWQVFPNSNYLALQFANENSAWISGKNKIAKLTLRP